MVSTGLVVLPDCLLADSSCVVAKYERIPVWVPGTSYTMFDASFTPLKPGVALISLASALKNVEMLAY